MVDCKGKIRAGGIYQYLFFSEHGVIQIGGGGSEHDERVYSMDGKERAMSWVDKRTTGEEREWNQCREDEY